MDFWFSSVWPRAFGTLDRYRPADMISKVGNPFAAGRCFRASSRARGPTNSEWMRIIRVTKRRAALD